MLPLSSVDAKVLFTTAFIWLIYEPINTGITKNSICLIFSSLKFTVNLCLYPFLLIKATEIIIELYMQLKFHKP